MPTGEFPRETLLLRSTLQSPSRGAGEKSQAPRRPRGTSVSAGAAKGSGHPFLSRQAVPGEAGGSVRPTGRGPAKATGCSPHGTSESRPTPAWDQARAVATGQRWTGLCPRRWRSTRPGRRRHRSPVGEGAQRGAVGVGCVQSGEENRGPVSAARTVGTALAGGAWAARSAKRPTSARVMIARLASSSPASGWLHRHGACLGVSLSPPLPCSFSLSLKTNKLKDKQQYLLTSETPRRVPGVARNGSHANAAPNSLRVAEEETESRGRQATRSRSQAGGGGGGSGVRKAASGQA